MKTNRAVVVGCCGSLAQHPGECAANVPQSGRAARGRVEKLAARLRVPIATLYRWLEGEAEVPTPIFLKAVDMVMPSWSPEDELWAQAMAAKRPKKIE